MSAIVGFLGLDGRPAKAEDLERMVEILAHRGPDGRAIWVEGAVGLGHCMLHTTPESLNEHLPFERDGLVITADARIDNREELIDGLQLKAHQPEQISDSELILYAYRRWGEECPEHLLGDFAFAIWDPAKQHLFCARDHFGVKPFYYYYQPGQLFVFATEIKAIFCYEDIPKQLNEVKISDYMLGMFEDKARTFYVDINRLLPASVMVIGKGGIRQYEYWAFDPKKQIKLKSDAEYAEAYRSLFIEAVRCRLRSAFPIGSMLSGGLDSSSIACVARDLLATNKGQDLHTFSIIFNEIKKSDEREYIYKVLENKNFIAHYIEGDQATPFDDLEKILWHLDEPFYAPNLFLHWQAWSAVRGSGVRVLLDGTFGDNVLSHGEEYLEELANRWHWLMLAREIRQIIEHSNWKLSPVRILFRYFIQHGLKPYIPEAVLKLYRYLRGNSTNPVENSCLVFQGDFVTRTGLQKRLLKAYAYNRSTKRTQQAHHTLFANGLVQTVLEIANSGSSAFHVESRFPFIDKRLVQFCLGLPGSQKVSQGYTRIIARRALNGILPEEIRWRSSKGNLGWNFRHGFKAREDLVRAAFDSSDAFLGDYLNEDNLRNMYNRCSSGVMAENDVLALFPFVVLKSWRSRLNPPGVKTEDYRVDVLRRSWNPGL